MLLAGLYLYLVNELRGLKDLVLPLLISLFIQSTVAVGQILAQHSLGIKSLGELDLDPARNGISVVTANGVRALRAYGLSDHPNILGGCLVFALILITAWFIGEAKRGRLVASSLVALGTLGLFFTFSRAAWLAYGIALLFMVFVLIRKRQQEPVMRWLSLAAASLLIVIPFVIQNASYLGMRLGWQNSFKTDAQEVQSLGERQLLMSDANHIFLQHPLTGVGLGAFPLALLQAFPQFPVDYQPPHIVLLDASAETGIFGGIFYLIASVAPWVLLWLNRKRLTLSPALLGSSALLLAISVVSLFDYYPWILISGALWQWLAWGVWSASFLAALHGKDDPYD